jgi:hypothetical protein
LTARDLATLHPDVVVRFESYTIAMSGSGYKHVFRFVGRLANRRRFSIEAVTDNAGINGLWVHTEPIDMQSLYSITQLCDPKFEDE